MSKIPTLSVPNSVKGFLQPSPYIAGALPPSVAERQARNVQLDDSIRRGMLKHKLRHSWGRAKSYPHPTTVPSFDPKIEAATGWTEPEMNAALHAAGRTAYGGLLSPSIRLGTEFYTSTLDRPKDDEATDLDESNVIAKWVRSPRPKLLGYTPGKLTDYDAVRDMWADEYSQELYDTGITTLQEMIDKGIARPEDFSAGRNLPNETRRPVAPDNTYERFGDIKPAPRNPRIGMGPEGLYPNDYSNQQLYNRDVSRLQWFLKPDVDPLVTETRAPSVRGFFSGLIPEAEAADLNRGGAPFSVSPAKEYWRNLSQSWTDRRNKWYNAAQDRDQTPAGVSLNIAPQQKPYIGIPMIEGSLLEEPTNIDNLNTLLINTLNPISTGSGMGGIIEETPEGTVQTDLEPTFNMPVIDAF